MNMEAKTAAAVAELGRAAARHVGIPDDVEITMTICPDRQYEWCGLVDGEPISREAEGEKIKPDVSHTVRPQRQKEGFGASQE